MNIKKISFFIAIFLGLMTELSGCTEGGGLYANTTDFEALMAQTRLVEQSTPPTKAKIRIIDKSELPKGIQPIRLKSKAELEDFIQKVNNIEFLTPAIPTPAIPGVDFIQVKTRSEGEGGAGIKTISSDLDGSGQYRILIDFAYVQKGQGEIQVGSKNANTWPNASWTHDMGVASWIGASSIQYSLTGTVKWYLILEWNFIEISRQSFTVSGTEQV